ncbi:hypothetical protein BU16DRAFT_530133 [Lophium mytilinum]|uniref:SnoaL-like domain-containing protein n=1 Tax=Lophium mytilinum TaxID=390894 RepID=A0A6A6QJ27_9PEZI|nr:hypothetical protein BU16DRAFT_530133 [Lophium mytilinum]
MSSHVETTRAFLHAFTPLTPEAFSPLLAANYHHSFLPPSVAIHAPFTRDGFLAHVASMSRVMTGFPVTPTEIFEDPARNAVVAFATSEVVWNGEVVEAVRKEEGEEGEWKYEGSYVFALWFDEAGLVQRVVEFVDSEGTGRARGLIKRALGLVGGK